jgi:aldehyde:ferredoxin oxidoreductase
MTEQVPGGYHGKILRVNLSSGRVSTEAIDEQFCRKHLGGAGFVSYFLLNETSPGIDPLSPENKIVFALGPLTGISLPGSGRHCVGAKSPLTGGIAKSEVGGFWGAELKRAGFDVIIVEGKSPKPVYLWVYDGEASIRDAGHLWGKNTKETQETIRAEMGDNKVRVALIGPGGENLVKYANIMHDLGDAAGRNGMGAVMGSKNLKAIAVRGNKAPSVVNPSGVTVLRRWLTDNWKLVTGLADFGTTGAMPRFEELGNLPVRNFRDSAFPEVNKISAQTLKDSIRIGMDGCFACPIRCKKVVEVNEPYHVDHAYGGPEYETLASLGSDCGIDDLKAIARGNELCAAYSLDTISTGCTIAFAMECFENGLLTTKDTGGIELKFGNAEAMLQVIELIARRQGIGNLLAEGSARAAEKIGNRAEAFALHVKKQEIPMHEPRLNKALGLGYMVNPHGADHCCNMIEIMFNGLSPEAKITIKDTIPLGMIEPVPFNDIGPRKVALFRIVQLKRIICDSLVLCQLLPYSFQQLAEVTSAVTGWNTTPMGQLRVAERTLTMCRLFNVRQGLTANDDKLPERFFKPTRDGATADKSLDPEELDKAKRYYYSLMGWDDSGVPTPEKLEELGIV